jgi:branched-chain amino acid transport system ATP-binding protein
MLSVKGLSSGYGQVRALNGVDVAVEPGEIVALLGRNGAGKTTLVQSIAGLLPAWSGRVEFDGRDITNLSPDRRCHLGLATVLDGKRVFHSQTVRQNLELPSVPKSSLSRRSYQELTVELFPVLTQFAKRRAGSLSGGQQQMLVIAQALMMRPTILMFDEPSAGLAPAIVEQLFGAIRSLADLGLGVLLVEQMLDWTLRISDKATVLEVGQTVGVWDSPRADASDIRDALRLAKST